jgi:hypothetical protein
MDRVAGWSTRFPRVTRKHVASAFDFGALMDRRSQAPVLRLGFGTPRSSRDLPRHSLSISWSARHLLRSARSAFPRERVRSMTHTGHSAPGLVATRKMCRREAIIGKETTALQPSRL